MSRNGGWPAFSAESLWRKSLRFIFLRNCARRAACPQGQAVIPRALAASRGGVLPKMGRPAHFPRSSISCATTEGSARVLMSPYQGVRLVSVTAK